MLADMFLEEVYRYALAVVSNSFGIAMLVYGAVEVITVFCGTKYLPDRIKNMSWRWRLGILAILLLCAQFVAWREQYRLANVPQHIVYRELSETVDQLSLSVELHFGSFYPVALKVICDKAVAVRDIRLSINERAVVNPTWTSDGNAIEIRFDGPALDMNHPLQIDFLGTGGVRVLAVEPMLR